MSQEIRDVALIWNTVYASAFVALLMRKPPKFGLPMNRRAVAAVAVDMADAAITLAPSRRVTVGEGPAQGQPLADAPGREDRPDDR